MPEFYNTVQFPIVFVPEVNNSCCTMPKKPKTVVRQPPPIDPDIRLKWGLALLGKKKASEYLAWLRARFDSKPRLVS